MLPMKKIFALILTSLTPLHALAFEPDVVAMADISTVEKYLNRLESFQADFEQFVPGAPFSEGVFYLKRPGKFLWQYVKPTPHKLISDGGLIYYEDGETNQVTQVPRGGFADVFGKNHLRLLGGDIQVIDHMRDEDSIAITIELEATDAEDFQSSNRLQFMFSREPLQLKQMVTSNQLGQDIVVTFGNIKENTPIKDSVFAYIPPHYEDDF